LDPRLKALQTIDWLYDRMWEAIVTIYHLEEHGEKKIIPAKRWRDGLVAEGRQTLDDVRELDKVLGRSAICLLTTSGIIHDNHRFHDKVITSGLLDRLLRHAPKRGQRKGRSSGKVAVLCTWDPGDCSFIQIWDWALKKNIRLPNWDPDYSKGLSWKTAEKIRNFAHEQNLAFHSDREKHAARAAFDRSLREQHPYLPFGQARKSASELAKPQLVAGEYVERVAEPTAVMGPEIVDVPQTLPARERADDRIPDKGPRRGGAAATRKSVATRNRNNPRKAEQTPPLPPAQARDGVAAGNTTSSLTNAEAQALLAQLAQDLD
jgi:putative transposase